METGHTSVSCDYAKQYATETPLLNAARFPQELFDAVIDCLSSDLVTLKQCSLVDRSWAASASQHLFYRISWPLRCSVCSPVSEDALLPEIYTVEAHPVKLASLDQAIRARRTSNAIRELNLSSLRHFPSSMVPVTDSFPLNDLLHVLNSLPRLHTLELTDCLLKPSSPPLVSSATQSIKNIRIRNTKGNERTASLSTIIQLLSHFDHLSCLSIEGIIPNDTQTVHTPTHRTRIATLEFLPPPRIGRASSWLPPYRPLETMLQALKTQVAPGALDTLALRYWYMPHLHPLLQSAPHLTTLVFHASRSPPALHPAVRLRALTAVFLSTDHAADFPPTFRHDVPTPWERPMRAFGRLATGALEEVTIVLIEGRYSAHRLPHTSPHVSPEEEYMDELSALLCATDWAALVAFLIDCPSLKKFRFELRIHLTEAARRAVDHARCLQVVQQVTNEHLTGHIGELSEVLVVIEGL